MDIFQAARPAVDIVFTVAGAEEAPRDDDFREFRIQGVVAVIEVQRDFRCPLGPAGLGPGKDDVFRLLPPQLADILFPHDPADASEILLLPLPLGPTMAVMPLSKVRVVLSAKDLNPRSSIFNNCIVSTLSVDCPGGHGMAPHGSPAYLLVQLMIP